MYVDVAIQNTVTNSDLMLMGVGLLLFLIILIFLRQVYTPTVKV